jgi:hypothetical protein
MSAVNTPTVTAPIFDVVRIQLPPFRDEVRGAGSDHSFAAVVCPPVEPAPPRQPPAKPSTVIPDSGRSSRVDPTCTGRNQ